MGVADLKNHVVKKVFSLPEGTSGKLSCVALLIAVIFFIASFCAGMFSTVSVTKNMVITSMHWDGLKSNNTEWSVGFPQVVFCPFFEHGVIVNITCKKANKVFDDKSVFMFPKDIMANNRTCKGYNTDGMQVTDVTMSMSCSMNTTDKGRYGNETRIATVRVYIDSPGTTEFIDCQNCVDGIDGTLLPANTTTLAFFEADLIEADYTDDDDDTVVDYKTWSTRMPTQPQLGESSNMDIALGFYTMDVWEFKGVDKYAAQFAGDYFGDFVMLLGGCGIFSYGIYVFISTLLILLVVGDEQTGTGTSTEKRALLG